MANQATKVLEWLVARWSFVLVFVVLFAMTLAAIIIQAKLFFEPSSEEAILLPIFSR